MPQSDHDMTDHPPAAAAPASAGSSPWRDDPLRARPGFLIRRLHQIHTALFKDECGRHGVSPLMYSVLSALSQSGPLPQTALALQIAVDKTNVVDLLERMKRRGMVRRRVSPNDRRVRLIELTAEGRALLDVIDAAAERAHIRTLEDLSPADRDTLVTLMAQIVQAKTGQDDRLDLDPRHVDDTAEPDA